MIQITVTRTPKDDDTFGCPIAIKNGRSTTHCEDLAHAVRRIGSVLERMLAVDAEDASWPKVAQ